MIDLGTTLVDPTPTILTLAEIGAAAVHYDLPIVLDVPPCDGTTPDDATAMRRLATLARPDWLLAVRRHSVVCKPGVVCNTETRIDRLCIAGNGDAAVLATREPDTVVLRDLPGDRSAPVLDLLGCSPALQFDTVNLVTDGLAALVDSARSTSAITRRLTALGLEESAAETLATALRHHLSHTQIVAIARGAQFGEHLTVFDSADGRLLVTSSLAADGIRWSSMTSGTTIKIGQAVRTLIEGTRRFSRSDCPVPG